MLRNSIPVRTAAEPKNSYRLYREQLKTDFNNRCGYCDAPDDVLWARGPYHIDHFAPHSKFSDLKETYGNLVYACPFCNRAKSDKWHGECADTPNDGCIGFVDPCSHEYDQHLSRSTEGKIVAVSALGEHIRNELKLKLSRHQMAWQSEAFLKLRDRIDALLEVIPEEDVNEVRLLRKFKELTKHYEQSKRAAL